jgi:hypothetical protein
LLKKISTQNGLGNIGLKEFVLESLIIEREFF